MDLYVRRVVSWLTKDHRDEMETAADVQSDGRQVRVKVRVDLLASEPHGLAQRVAILDDSNTHVL